ncbi:hypothetical protein ACVBEG_03110 [Pseudomonas sp. GG8]
MNWFKTLLAKFAGSRHIEEIAMPEVDAATAVIPVSPTELNTDTLKALLLALGHDVEADWEHLVALAKKAI